MVLKAWEQGLITACIRTTYENQGQCPGREDLDRLFRTVLDRRGVDISLYKKKFLMRRIAVRLRANDNISMEDYTALLTNDDNELSRFLDVITVNVSDFFRNPALYESLKNKFLPVLIKSKTGTGDKLRIWSAGCSTGQEPYSLAINLLECFKSAEMNVPFIITATDIDRKALDIAEKGIYSASKVAGVPSGMRSEYFDFDIDQDTYSVKKPVKMNIEFKKHDLLTPIDGKLFDMIVCRNVLIYFSRELQQKLFSYFNEKLNPGSYLILGQVERILGENDIFFNCVDGRNHIYMKANGELT